VVLSSMVVVFGVASPLAGWFLGPIRALG
jgi:hypothetical protein